MAANGLLTPAQTVSTIVSSSSSTVSIESTELQLQMKLGVIMSNTASAKERLAHRSKILSGLKAELIPLEANIKKMEKIILAAKPSMFAVNGSRFVKPSEEQQKKNETKKKAEEELRILREKKQNKVKQIDEQSKEVNESEEELKELRKQKEEATIQATKHQAVSESDTQASPQSLDGSSSLPEAHFLFKIPRSIEDGYWQYLMEEVSHLMTEPQNNQASNHRLNDALDELNKFSAKYPSREADVRELMNTLLDYTNAATKTISVENSTSYYVKMLGNQENVPSDGNCFFWASARQFIHLFRSNRDLIALLPPHFTTLLNEELSPEFKTTPITALLDHVEMNRPFRHLRFNLGVTKLESLFQKALRKAIARQLDKLERKLDSFPSDEAFVPEISFIRDVLNGAIADRNVSWYELRIMPIEDVELEEWQLYITKIEDSLQYAVMDPSRNVVRDSISKDELSKFPGLLATVEKPFDINRIKPFLSEVLEITSKRGHTQKKENESIDKVRLMQIADYLNEIETEVVRPIIDTTSIPQGETLEQREGRELRTQRKSNGRIAMSLRISATSRENWNKVLMNLKKLLLTDGYYVGNEALLLMSWFFPNIAICSDVHTYTGTKAVSTRYYFNKQQHDTIPTGTPTIHLIKVPWAHYNSAGILLGALHAPPYVPLPLIAEGADSDRKEEKGSSNSKKICNHQSETTPMRAGMFPFKITQKRGILPPDEIGQIDGGDIEQPETLFEYRATRKILLKEKENLEKTWRPGSFEALLKLEFISRHKASEIDCKFEDIDVSSLKSILHKTTQKLLVNKNQKTSKIIIIRRFLGKLMVFTLGIEDCKENKKKGKRCEFKIFSSYFSEDVKSDLRHSFDNIVSTLKYQSDIEVENVKIFKEFISTDFLKTGNIKGQTRLECYSIPENEKYPETVLLHKLFSIFQFEKTELGDDESIGKLNLEYIEKSGNYFIRDTNVAKTQLGIAYEEYLTMLLAYLANKSDHINNFSLTFEVNMPLAWNDIVFDWNGQLVFIQQKHRSEHAFTVDESYSTTELLASEGDASILKYYRAYCKVVTLIKDPRHPLRHYKDQLDSKKIKFIFFTNRKLPLEPQSKGGFTLKKNKNKNKNKKIDSINEEIVFEKVTSDEAPLMTLKGFKEVIGERPIHKIRSCTVAQLGLEPNDEEMLNNFLESFYFFSNQKNSSELLNHCKDIIKAKREGFGQGSIVEDFGKYIHNEFISDKPEHHVYDRKLINNFFEDHEIRHHNLVQYSCPPHQTRIFELNDDLKPLYDLPCIENIKKILNDQSQVIIFCHEPRQALSIIQGLFPAGERQIFISGSQRLNKYELASSLRYAITVEEDPELLGVIEKIKSSSKHRHTKIIQIKMLSSKPNNIIETNYLTLTVKAEQLEFVKEKYPLLTLLDSKTEMCLTDLLLFATHKLTQGLSSEEYSKYVPQELSKEETILPYNKLEEGIRAWIEKYPDFVKTSWLEDTKCFLNVIQINLPRHLPKISTKEVPSGGAFFWNEEILTFVYLSITCDLKDNDARYKMMWPDTEEVNLKNLLEKVHNHIEAHHPDLYYKYQNQHLPLYKEITQLPRYISIKLCRPYTGIPLPKENWSMSRDNTTIFYHHDGKPKLLSLDWSSIHSTSTISVVEAEAACGKTWFLKSKINLEKTLKDNRIPVFISIKDFEKVKNVAELTSGIIDQSSLPSYLRRIAKQWPKYFHLLLDGFDELPQSLLGHFEIMLKKIISKDYSVTITVRDYQTHTLQKKVTHIILKNRLHKFDDKKIKECLEKALDRKIPIETFDVEINRLCHFINQQTNLGEWLGIPLHITLLSEWYILNGRSLQEVSNPSIAEIYNFIIQHRIKRNSKMNPADFYKFLYVTAINQVSDKNKFPLVLSFKRYNFKKEVRFDLGRSGLLKNPFFEKPELFHRSFAEFFIAKKLSRKIIKNPENSEFNLKLIQFLYQTENRLICYFFIELLKIHHTDSDISYELTGSQHNEFSNNWLLDLIGQKLSEHKKGGVITFQVLECPKKSNDIEEFGYQPKNAKELMDALRKNTPVSIDLSTSVGDWINTNDLSLDGLLTLLSPGFRESWNVGSCFNILGLYLRIKNNHTVRGEIFGAITAPQCLENCLRQNYDVLLWWKIDDLLSVIVANKRLAANSKTYVDIDLIRNVILDLSLSSRALFGNKLLASSKKNICEMLSILEPSFRMPENNWHFGPRPRRRERHPSFREKENPYAKYLKLCFAIYQNTHNIEILDVLHIFIRKLDIEGRFLSSYPGGWPSIFKQYKMLCEFDIDSVKKAFIQLKEMCKNEDFLCDKPSFFARIRNHFDRPVQVCIGPHLNIVHVFYLILGKPYHTTADFVFLSELSRMTYHIETINPEIDLKVIFCSALAFLSLVSRRESTQEHPKLSTIVADNLVRIFERLLNSPEINPKANLFIRILFVNFMLYFDLRGYVVQPSKEEAELSILTLIASNGYRATLNICFDANLLLEYRQIASCSSRIKCEEDRLQYFFNIWEECAKNKLQLAPHVLSSFDIGSHASTHHITKSSQLEKTVSLKQGTKRNVVELTNETLPISSTVTGNDALGTEGGNGNKRTKLTNNKDTLSYSSGREAAERGLPGARTVPIIFTEVNEAVKGKVLLLSSEACRLGYDTEGSRSDEVIRRAMEEFRNCTNKNKELEKENKKLTERLRMYEAQSLQTLSLTSRTTTATPLSSNSSLSPDLEAIGVSSSSSSALMQMVPLLLFSAGAPSEVKGYDWPVIKEFAKKLADDSRKGLVLPPEALNQIKKCLYPPFDDYDYTNQDPEQVLNRRSEHCKTLYDRDLKLENPHLQESASATIASSSPSRNSPNTVVRIPGSGSTATDASVGPSQLKKIRVTT
jgi:hypothetical protein